MNREFSTPNAPKPLGHYSQGVKQAGSTQVSMQLQAGGGRYPGADRAGAEKLRGRDEGSLPGPACDR